MKNKFIIPSLVVILCCCLCCTSKVAPENGVELSQVKLRLVSPLEVKPGQEVSCAFETDRGPMKSDEIVLRAEGTEDISIAINSIDKYSFKYTIPQRFQYGTYSFCLRRKGILRGFGKVEYAIPGSTGPGNGGDDSQIGPAEGSTVWGQISCNGVGVPDVVVSDGYEVVKTDAKGVYQMASAKKNNYVFISVPSGYEVANSGVLPLFHKTLTRASGIAERVDFTLFEAGDQTNHTILYFGDMHMANRTKDRTQFRTFTSEVNEYMKAHSNEKVYAITLGDMTWDLYWYQNNYCFDEYLTDVNAISGLQIFHTIGNHDHDMNAVGDWDTVEKYKQRICPNYYSFNIGKIHYVVLDNIQCTNATASTTDGSVRQYNDYLVSEDLDWLKKDLAFVDKTTPVVITMHAPVYNKDGGASLNNTSALTSAINGYDVTIVTGHTHVIYNVNKTSTLREHNSGAVCGAWWWAGKYNPTFNLATDGAPNGYRITSVSGTRQESFYKAIGRPADYQFRAYDRNQILLTAANTGVPANRENILFEEDYGGYHLSNKSNEVLINVWDWDPSWRVEVTENGKNLTVTQVTNTYDPAFLIAYTVPRLKENNGASWHSSKINHMFKATASSATSTVEIKVTDDEGRVYKETMQRPRAFTVDTYK